MLDRLFSILPGPARLLFAGVLALGLIDVSAADLDFVDSGQLLGNDQGKAVALGDLDGDGDLDAFIANGYDFTSNPNKIYINQGGAQGGMAGQLQASGQLLGGSSNSQAVALGDLDGDGDLDAFVANGFNIAGSADVIYWNDGNGTFQAAVQDLGSQTSSDVALADIDGDGDLDAVVTHPNNGLPNRIWINQGGMQGGAEGTLVDGGALGTSAARTVALADLDGDGDVDAIIGGALTGLEIWINQGGAQAGTPGTFADSGQRLVLGNAITEAVYLVDFNGDGHLDAYAANNGFNPEDVIWMNPGPEAAGNPGQFQAGWTGPARVSFGTAIADFDGDGDPDAFVAHAAPSGGRANAVWLNDGSGMLSDTGLALGDSQSAAAAAGDMDGDGDIDVLVVNGAIQAQPDRLWLAETSVSGPGIADLVFEATPQGSFEVDIDNPARTPPAGMELTVTNLGPDPASNVVIQYREQPSSGSIFVDLPVNSRFTCAPGQTEGQQVCTAPLFPAGHAETINMDSGSLFGPIVRLRFFQGEQTYEASLTSGSTDPTPGGRSAFVSHTGYDCRRAICPIQRWFCLTGPFWPTPISRAASGESQALGGGFLIDLPVYYLVRQTMNYGSDGQRLVQRYVAHGDEIGDLTVQNPALFDDAIEVLAAWQPLLAALVSGDPESEFVTQARVDLLDDFLAQLEMLGSPALAQAIADERLLIGPFIDLVGLTAGQAADLLIPSEVIFENSFERPEILTD